MKDAMVGWRLFRSTFIYLRKWQKHAHSVIIVAYLYPINTVGLMDICNVGFSQSLNLYVHIPIVVISLLLGLLVLLSDRKNPINRNLFLFILFAIFWVLNDFLQWLTFDENSILLFSRLSVLGSFALLFFLLFAYAYSGKDFSIKKKMLFFLPFLPLVLFVLSDSNASIDPNGNCDVSLGPLYIYLVLILISYTVWSIIVLVSYFRKNKENKRIRNQVKIIASGFACFILWIIGIIVLTSFSFFTNYIGGDDASLFISVSMLFLVSFTVYAIVKYQLMNIKVILTQIAVIGLLVLIGSQFFFIKVTINYILTGITFVLAAGFGLMLIRSVKVEIERKEELQKISDSLAMANQRLKELDLTKSEFISIASHQLRTPLTAIKGYISLLLEGSYGEISPTVQDILDKVYSVNSRLVRLVEDLLNVSRIEAGRIQYSFAKTQLEPLIVELVDMFKPTAKSKKLALLMKLSEKPLPQLTIDPNKIKEVLSNLIDNALKYTKEGSVTVSLEGDKKVARIIVTDTGIGIRPEDEKNLFEKFTRSKETTKMVASGAGLGLYVGKNFVEAHGGRIWAESPGADKGSRFIIELPLVNPNIHVGTSDQPSPSEKA